MEKTDTIARGPRTGAGPGRATGTENGRFQEPSGKKAVATLVEPLLRALYRDEVPVRFVFWDASALGPEEAPTVSVLSADALRHILWAPGELGLARAYVAGLITVEGGVVQTLRVLHDSASTDLRSAGLALTRKLLPAARELRLLRRPPAPPAVEAHPAGRLHSRRRDAAAVSHHYDGGNDFHRLVLGQSMTYSCARFVSDGSTFEEVQRAKHELTCHKLGLDRRRGMTLLDVGCGWGRLCLHAAERYGAHVVGVTLSREQAEWASRRIDQAGLRESVEIRLEDYRSLKGELFDAISSVGMFEHVGSSRCVGWWLSPGCGGPYHLLLTARGDVVRWAWRWSSPETPK